MIHYNVDVVKILDKNIRISSCKILIEEYILT